MTKPWENKTVRLLVELRHNFKYIEKFRNVSNKAIQIKQVWEELASEIGPEIKGVDAKEKYYYFLKMFRQYDSKAKLSVNSSISWRHYYFLKQYLNQI